MIYKQIKLLDTFPWNGVTIIWMNVPVISNHNLIQDVVHL